jgi:glycosyltransferase
MKISIIMASNNSEKFIERSLISLEQQSYNNIEFIIVDNVSTDRTIGIVKKYQHMVDIFVCEKDEGLYYALNKGIELATGEVIGFLHSDDVFANPNVLSEVMDAFNSNDVDCVYGDCSFLDPKKGFKRTRVWRAGLATEYKFSFGWMPPHTATFFRKNVYENYGNFNTLFKISADYELLLRFFLSPDFKFLYLRKTIIFMNRGGLSNNNINNLVRKFLEDVRACKIHKMSGYRVAILKRLKKILQFKVF